MYSSRVDVPYSSRCCFILLSVTLSRLAFRTWRSVRVDRSPSLLRFPSVPPDRQTWPSTLPPRVSPSATTFLGGTTVGAKSCDPKRHTAAQSGVTFVFVTPLAPSEDTLTGVPVSYDVSFPESRSQGQRKLRVVPRVGKKKRTHGHSVMKRR